MPKQNSEGKFIISASEVSTYILCPESWRLMYVDKVKYEKQGSPETSEVEKERWLEDFDAARNFTWASRIVVFMIFFLCIFYLFMNV